MITTAPCARSTEVPSSSSAMTRITGKSTTTTEITTVGTTMTMATVTTMATEETTDSHLLILQRAGVQTGPYHFKPRCTSRCTTVRCTKKSAVPQQHLRIWSV